MSKTPSPLEQYQAAITAGNTHLANSIASDMLTEIDNQHCAAMRQAAYTTSQALKSLRSNLGEECPQAVGQSIGITLRSVEEIGERYQRGR